jgi:hypothetical protein
MNFRGIALVFLLCSGLAAGAQSFDLIDRSDNYTAGISQSVKIPLKIKNTSEKPQFYVVRITSSDLSGSQKGFFCIDKDCLEPGITEFSKRVEAGATLDGLFYSLETGLVTGQYNIQFEIFVKGNLQSAVQHPVNVMIEEKQSRSLVFQSREITVHEVYPNPVFDFAFVDYRLHLENVKAKLVVHNILGSSMTSLDLPFTETKAKIEAQDFTPGVYFYTVYLDNIGVFTRKLIVRR